jgi:hypothetical protein
LQIDLRVFDKRGKEREKKRKRQGKEEEKKRLIKNKYSASLPHLFLFSSLSLPSFIFGNKKKFSNSFTFREKSNVKSVFSP